MTGRYPPRQTHTPTVGNSKYSRSSESPNVTTSKYTKDTTTLTPTLDGPKSSTVSREKESDSYAKYLKDTRDKDTANTPITSPAPRVRDRDTAGGTKYGDTTSKYGDTTSKYGDTTSKYGDTTSKYDHTSKYEDRSTKTTYTRRYVSPPATTGAPSSTGTRVYSSRDDKSKADREQARLLQEIQKKWDREKKKELKEMERFLKEWERSWKEIDRKERESERRGAEFEKKNDRENKDHERNFLDFQKGVEKKEEVRKEREEQNKQRFLERIENRKTDAESRRNTYQSRWDQKMTKRIARNNVQQQKRVDRLRVRAENYTKRRRDEEKAEIERRKRRKEFYLFPYQMRWDLEDIQSRYQHVKGAQWELAEGLREEVRRKTFQRGDFTVNQVVDELDDEQELYDEDHPYFGLTKAEIAELKRLQAEEELLDRLAAQESGVDHTPHEEYEGAIPEKAPTKSNNQSHIKDDEPTDADLALLDELELAKIEKEEKKAATQAPPPNTTTTKAAPPVTEKAPPPTTAEDDDEEELRRLEEEELDDDEAELRRLEEEEARLNQTENLAKGGGENKTDRALDEEEEEELRRLQEEEEELRRLEEEEALLDDE